MTRIRKYVAPGDVRSPKRRWTLLEVVHDRGEGHAAVALGYFDGKRKVAVRWNGRGEDNPIGNPQSRGLATWFILPTELHLAVLREVLKLAPSGKRALVRSFARELSRSKK